MYVYGMCQCGGEVCSVPYSMRAGRQRERRKKEKRERWRERARKWEIVGVEGRKRKGETDRGRKREGAEGS